MEQPAENRFICPDCQASFLMEHHLARHKAVYHTLTHMFAFFRRKHR